MTMMIFHKAFFGAPSALGALRSACDACGSNSAAMGSSKCNVGDTVLHYLNIVQ